MHPGILVGIGFVAGTVGLKAVTSKAARNLAVKGLVQGMKAKEQCETLLEEAKAEFDDIVAEAEFEVNDAAIVDEVVDAADDAADDAASAAEAE